MSRNHNTQDKPTGCCYCSLPFQLRRIPKHKNYVPHASFWRKLICASKGNSIGGRRSVTVGLVSVSMTAVEEARSRMEGGHRSFAAKWERENRRVGMKEESGGESVYIPATVPPIAIRQHQQSEKNGLCRTIQSVGILCSVL